MLTLPPNDYFRHFSMTDFLGADLNWKKILEMTETVSDSNVAVSIKGKTTFCWACEINTIFYNNKTSMIKHIVELYLFYRCIANGNQYKQASHCNSR